MEISEGKVLNTKFSLSLQTIIALTIGVSTLIGMWYALQSDIKKAKGELYKQMFEVDSIMMQIQMQIDSTSLDFQKLYINAQRINNGHE